jgi:hypothetical protein
MVSDPLIRSRRYNPIPRQGAKYIICHFRLKKRRHEDGLKRPFYSRTLLAVLHRAWFAYARECFFGRLHCLRELRLQNRIRVRTWF